MHFLLIFLFSTSIILAQTGLKGSGDLQHLKDKLDNYTDGRIGDIQALYPEATIQKLKDAMVETAFLKNGDKYVPAINEVSNGCVCGGIGRGVGYLDNSTKGNAGGGSGNSLGQGVAKDMQDKLTDRGLFDKHGASGSPDKWAAAKREITHERKRKIGRDIETMVFDFPKNAGTPSSSTSANYAQPTNIQDALQTIGKALNNGHAVELRMDNGTGCGTTGYHFALAYRMVEFKGFDGLWGISFVDDGNSDGSSGQGDGEAENYERGIYIFDKNGNCLTRKGMKITHFFIEKFKR